MPTSLIGRVVAWDLLKVTFLTLVAISGLFVLGGAMLEANKLHLDAFRVLRIMPLLIPPTIPYSLPTSLLFACTFVYSRLSANQEIVALKAGGVHVGHVMAPAMVLGIGLAVVGIYSTDRFIPACEARVNQLLMDDIQANIFAYLKQQGMIVDPKFPYEIYVGEVRDGHLINAIFKKRGDDGKFDSVVKAKLATIEVVPAAQVASAHVAPAEPILEVRLMNSVAWSKSAQGHWSDQTYRMPLPAAVKADHRTSALSFAQCMQASWEHASKADEADYYLASAGALNALQGDFGPLAQVWATNRAYAERQARRSNEMMVEIHTRISQSTASLLFALLGCPIGILLRRRDYLQTFFISFLPIVVTFYPSLLLARNLVKEGYVSPGISVWAPTAVLLLASLPLIRRVVRH